MTVRQPARKVSISPKSYDLLCQLLDENPEVLRFISESSDEGEFKQKIRDWVGKYLKGSVAATRFLEKEQFSRELFEELSWQDYAAIRIMDYLNNAGLIVEDRNARRKSVESDPFQGLWLAATQGSGGTGPPFFRDMRQLLRQFTGELKREFPTRELVAEWMARYPSGLDKDIVRLRRKSRRRIINQLIDRIDAGKVSSSKFKFPEDASRKQKVSMAEEWWKDYRFHLHFAIRNPETLNEMLDYSLSEEEMGRLRRAKSAGIPTFVNPYYLSLLHVRGGGFPIGTDLPIRHYILYSTRLVEEFGHIDAWEKEDIVEPGKPNAAGWLLPSHKSVHRRYPEVAVLIPETMGRACGGLCSSCQRMYDFQRGHLNFDLEKLAPDETWPQRLRRFMDYFENDSQLRDILITGGDALMSSDRSLAGILDAVLDMAVRKREANKSRPDGEKYAEILQVRLGTRLPVYLPQRVTPELVQVLKEFKERASAAGIRAFVIQTHFESTMEVTPEARRAVRQLHAAGWLVRNQQVFTASGARRGHSAKLRKVLNEVGVLTYYTFSVKGFMENSFNFATNARAVQEQFEEKVWGAVPAEYHDRINAIALDPEHELEGLDAVRRESGLPFLALDRTVLNLPGVGKSMTYRVIGITRRGRRILEFEHDPTRNHSPIIHKMGKVVVVESKTMSGYLDQLESFGEIRAEYESFWGYSLAATEPRMAIWDYPEYDFAATPEFTNLQIED